MAGVVVTGAAGHLGGCLVRTLRARGQQVRALVHRDRRALEGLDVEVIAGDVMNEESLRHAFSGADVVYHAAAYISISMGEHQRLHEINVVGTRNVVEACLHCGVKRLVHFSSIEVLECEPLCEPVDESRPLVQSQSALPYASSKAAGERQVRQGMARGLDAVILYPTAMIGPYDYRQGFPNAGLRAICEGRLWALVEGGFDWVDVRDVSKGALHAAERAPAGARYILSGHWASLHDLALLAREITGAPVPRLVCPMGLARVGAPFVTAACHLLGKQPLYTSAALVPLAGNRNISHARAANELGYRPRPLRRTVVDTMQWFESMGVSARQFPLTAAGGQLVDSPGGE